MNSKDVNVRLSNVERTLLSIQIAMAVVLTMTLINSIRRRLKPPTAVNPCFFLVMMEGEQTTERV